MARSEYREVIDRVTSHQGPSWFITSIDAYRHKNTGGVHWIVFMKRKPDVYFPGEDDTITLFVKHNSEGMLSIQPVEKQRIYFRVAKGTQKHYVKQGK